MEGAVDQRGAHVDQRVAGQDAVVHGLLDALVDRGDVLARDRAARDLVQELVAAAGARGLEVEHDVAVLAAAAGLAGELQVDLVDELRDRLAIRDLRLADVGVDVELAAEAVDDDVEVQLAHAGDHGLAGLVVEAHDERRVLVGELREPGAQLVLVGLGLGLDGDRDHGRREADLLEHDGLVRVTDRVAGGGVLQTDDRHDVARVGRGEVLAVVRVHLQHAADALLAVLRRVEHVRAALEHARVQAQVRETPDVGVGHDLEREGGERLVVAGLALDPIVLLERQVPLDRRHVDG